MSKKAQSGKRGRGKPAPPPKDRLLEISPRAWLLIAIAVFLILTLAMFADVLFTSKEIVLSSSNTDLPLQFIHWRKFGFDQLRQGNLPLWNPHIFSGAPYLAGFQSALLYPPNVVYLIFSLPKAINLGIALHVFLAGVFMYLWVSHRKLHPLACLLSSALFMFCAPHFLHIYAGHLPNLCTMIWAPLLFLSIDGLFEKRSLGWGLLGTFAITMQILAGHPQYVFFTAIAAAIYAGLCMIKAQRRLTVALVFIGMFAAAAFLTAVQLLPGMDAARESVRSTGLSYQFASMFSLPPENFLTLLAPGFFGNNTTLPYWGRCNLWEMSLFISVAGLILAIYGAIYGQRTHRRFSVTMVAILLLLALGSRTPLHRFLYTCVPGFNGFRGMSKFFFPASLFGIMLVGFGFDHLVRDGCTRRWTLVAPLAVGGLLTITALVIRSAATGGNIGWWHDVIKAVPASGELCLPDEVFADRRFARASAHFASTTLLISAGTLMLVGALFFFTRFSGKTKYAIGLLALIEIFVFARSSRGTFDLTSILPSQIDKFLAERPGDYRVLRIMRENWAMSTGTYDIWGYDPGVPRRYAELVAYTQGEDPDRATQYVRFNRPHRLFEMLRFRYGFFPEKNEVRTLELDDAMSRLHLVQEFVVVKDRDKIFAAMEDPDFDPRQRVILQSHPDPEPVRSEEKGTARVVDESTDHLTVEAELPSPAVLLITDSYSSGWRATALPGSTQQEYRLMPANYVLRAIPLAKGRHRIRVEYLPIAFQLGKWISIIALISYLFLLGWFYRRTSRLTGTVSRKPKAS